MSDYEGDENVPKGNEWEVVALTDSTYAASPSPKEGISESSTFGVENPETAQAVFMSGHFGSSSKQEAVPQQGEHTIGKSDSKKEGDMNMEGLVSDFGDVMRSSLIDEEQSIYDTEKSGSFHDDESIDQPVESLDRSDTCEISDVPKQQKEDEFHILSHETRWRKHAASIYAHAKNVNPVWSIVVAAAVVGFVIVGYYGWQRDKQQITQLKPRWATDGEGSRWILVGVQNSPYIGVLSSAER